MCTVTLIPRPDGYRLAVNRDELRTRPTAEPPHTFAHDGRRVLYPRDPQGGGTWIAVNDAGLTLTLLNLNETNTTERVAGNHDTTTNKLSRGLVVPQLAEAASVDEALQMADRLDPTRYAPFRVLAIDDDHTGTVRSDGRTLETRRRARPEQPMMLTSSGLGDAVVEGPRRAEFDGWFGGDPAQWPREQDRFHRQRFDDRPEVSVLMSRGDARTVCWSAITVNAGRVELAHRDLDEHGAASEPRHRLCLARAAAVPTSA